MNIKYARLRATGKDARAPSCSQGKKDSTIDILANRGEIWTEPFLIEADETDLREKRGRHTGYMRANRKMQTALRNVKRSSARPRPPKSDCPHKCRIVTPKCSQREQPGDVPTAKKALSLSPRPAQRRGKAREFNIPPSLACQQHDLPMAILESTEGGNFSRQIPRPNMRDIRKGIPREDL